MLERLFNQLLIVGLEVICVASLKEVTTFNLIWVITRLLFYSLSLCSRSYFGELTFGRGAWFVINRLRGLIIEPKLFFVHVLEVKVSRVGHFFASNKLMSNLNISSRRYYRNWQHISSVHILLIH